jgi:hypothetical protein
MKKFFTMLSIVAAMLISSQASAKNMCHEVKIIKGHLDHFNKALASKSAEGMKEAMEHLGIRPSKEVMSSGKVGLKLMLETQQGHLYTSLQLAEAGCHAQEHAERLSKKHEKAKHSIANSRAYHHAKDIAHSIKKLIVTHRHKVCGWHGRGFHRHFACRWRG